MNEIKKIYDLYEWLPPYGENSVKCITKGTDLLLVIEYDVKDNNKNEKEEMVLTFCHFSFFAKTAIPGPSFFPAYSKLNSDLTEIIDSDMAESWTTHYRKSGYIDINMHHYEVYFMAEEIFFSIVAESVQLKNIKSEEQLAESK